MVVMLTRLAGLTSAVSSACSVVGDAGSLEALSEGRFMMSRHQHRSFLPQGLRLLLGFVAYSPSIDAAS